MQGFKPLLAVDYGAVENIRFPMLASPKLDGIRAINIPGVGLRTRSLKPVPNAHVNALFDRPEYAGLDGELICGNPTAPDVFQKTTSAVMSRDGFPDVTFHVFDNVKDPSRVFRERYLLMGMMPIHTAHIQVVPQREVASVYDLDTYEAEFLAAGYEGLMLRDPYGRYKFGRSTLKEGILLKVKRFADTEAEVVGFEELMTNTNEQERDERGYAKRSSAKEGLRPTGTLGALIVKAPEFDKPFNVGTGFTAAQRAELWANRGALLGRLAKVKYQNVGCKDTARLPVFQGWRSRLDL